MTNKAPSAENMTLSAGNTVGNDGFMVGNDGFMVDNDGFMVGNDGFMREIGLEPRLNLTELERQATVEEYLNMKIQEEAAEAAKSRADPSVFSLITGIPYPQLLFCIPLIFCSWLMILGFIMPYFKQRDMLPSYRGVSDMHIRKACVIFVLIQIALGVANFFVGGYPVDSLLRMCLISNIFFLILDLLYTNLMITGYLAKFRHFDKGRFDMVNRLFHAIWYTSPFILTYGTVWCAGGFLCYYYYVLAALSFVGDMLCFRAFRMTVSFKSVKQIPKIIICFATGSFYCLLAQVLPMMEINEADSMSLNSVFVALVVLFQAFSNVIRLEWYDSRCV